MIEIIAQGLKIIFMLLGKWFELSAEKKAKAKEILKESKDANDPKSITRVFDKLNRL